MVLLVRHASLWQARGYEVREVFPGRVVCLTLAMGHGMIQVFASYLPGPTDRSGIDWGRVFESIAAAQVDGAFSIFAGEWNCVGHHEDRVPGGMVRRGLIADAGFRRLPAVTEVSATAYHTHGHYGGRSRSRVDRVW